MENNAIAEQLERIEQLITSQSLQNKPALNINEVAIYTGLSKLYIYKLSSKNLIPHYKPNGKNIYFKKDEIDSWLLRNRQSTQDEIQTEAINFVVNRKK